MQKVGRLEGPGSVTVEIEGCRGTEGTGAWREARALKCTRGGQEAPGVEEGV